MNKNIHSLAIAMLLAAGTAGACEKDAAAASQSSNVEKENKVYVNGDSLAGLRAAVQAAVQSKDKAKMKAALLRTESFFSRAQAPSEPPKEKAGMMGGGKDECKMMKDMGKDADKPIPAEKDSAQPDEHGQHHHG